MKKNLLSLVVLLSIAFNTTALNHGSMAGNNLPLYPQRNGATPGTAIAGVTFDFKMVTVGSKTWAWTNVTGGKTVSADAWASQLRYWEPTKTEINLTGRTDGNKQTFGSARLPNMNPLTVTYFQSWNNEFYETADFTYNYTLQNSANATDNIAPVLAAPTVVSQTSMQLKLLLSATDDSGNFFYYIEDAGNNFAEVSFFNDVTLSLTPDVDYTFSIYAIDFSGNQSAARVVGTHAVEPTWITNGTAKAISFKLDSRSLTELQIECTSNDLIGDAFVKLEINGVSLDPKEWKPVINQVVGTQKYQITVPAADIPGWAENAILGLNLGYITMPIGDWGHYVTENKFITTGENESSPILHKIGTGIDIEKPEPTPEYNCKNNLLEGMNMTVGENYYAPGWNPINTYTSGFAGGEVNITLPAATSEVWQGQFRFLFATPVVIDHDKKYGIMMTVRANNNLPFYAKFMDTDDNAFFEIPRTTVNAGTVTLKVMDLTPSAALTQITRVLFDFGGNPANTNIVVSDLTICDSFEAAGISEVVLTKGISYNQDANVIQVYAENGISSAKLYTIGGQIAASGTSEIGISALPKGIYILSVKDLAGNASAFKIAVK